MIRFALGAPYGGQLPEIIPPTTAILGSVDLRRASDNGYIGLIDRYPHNDILAVTIRGRMAQVFDLAGTRHTPSAVAEWVARMRDVGITPWIYCAARMRSHVYLACTRFRIDQPAWWNSTIAQGAYIPEGADATRYATTNAYDAHIIRDGPFIPPLFQNDLIVAAYR